MPIDGDIPVERWPGPVCRYVRTDDEAIVRNVDVGFRRTFGDAPTGEPVLKAFQNIGFTWLTQEPRVVDGIGSHDPAIVRVTVDGGRTDPFLVYNISVENERSGLLLFSEIPDPSVDGASNEWIDVDDVASVVSHDLRNPLDVANARLRAGRETSDNEHYERVAEALDRMERIIEDVLTLARGEEVVEPDDRTDLGETATRAWDMVRTVDATLTVAGELPTVVGDEDRIDRLFENLFRNAIEHGRRSIHDPSDSRDEQETGLGITVGGFRRGSTDGFFVADDGVGIPPEERSAVFQPGYSTDDHGTGLGLSIVARVVSLHGWSIEITESEAGGARFEITEIETA